MSVRDLVAAMSRRERKAWLGVLMVSPVVLYLLWALFLDPVGRSGGVTVVAWWVASYFSCAFLVAYYLLIQRFSAGMTVDERDHQIRAQAIGKGYIALVIACALVLGAVHSTDFGPVRTFVHSRSPEWVTVYLVLAVYSSAVVASGSRAFLYWRDRR